MATTLETFSIPHENSLTAIGKFAFYRCIKLKFANLSACSKLVLIDTSAFEECTSMSYITLPEGLATINAAAIRTTNISSITIPSTVKVIQNQCISYNYNLKEIIFAENCQLKSLLNFTFMYSAITTIKLPPFLTSLTGLALKNCDNLKNIEVDPKNTKYITDGKAIYSKDKSILYFVVCDIDSFEIPNSVTLLDVGCFVTSHLSTINIPNSVTAIEDSCFYNASTSTFNIPNTVTYFGQSCFRYAANLKTINLPTNITSIPDYLFQVSGLTTITIPDNVTYIGSNAFSYCSNLGKIYLPINLKDLGGAVKYNSPKAEFVFPEGSSIKMVDEMLVDVDMTYISQYVGSEVTNLIIPSSIATIKAYAFRNKKKLVSITCNETSKLEVIEDYAFADCTNLVDFPAFPAIKSIGMKAFMNTRLRNPISFGDSLTFIGDSAFNNVANLPSISFQSTSDLVITHRAFLACEDLSSVVLPMIAKVTLGEQTFCNCTKLQSISIPYNVVEIRNGRFSGSGITQVIFDGGYRLDNFPVELFKDCWKLSDITIPENVLVLNSRCLYNTSISVIKIPDSVTDIGIQCFKNCVELTTVNISDNSHLNTIAYGAFDGCIRFSKISEFKAKYYLSDYGAIYSSDMKRMVIYPPASVSKFFALAYSVKRIEESAFIGCKNLRSILIPDNTVTSIGNNAFEGCINLVNINIPLCVTIIGKDAFLGCRSLKCGVFVENRNPSFISQIIDAGLDRRSLSECVIMTCSMTRYTFNFLLFSVFIIM